MRATRTKILEAAARLAHERGPGGFSMDVLAKEAGVARATVYEHFRSKRAVLDELATSATRPVEVAATNEADSDPLRALRDTLAEMSQHWADEGDTMHEARTLAALTGGNGAVGTMDGESIRKLVDALAGGGHLRAHWTTDEAADALTMLTSYPTYERLSVGSRQPVQVAEILTKLAISIVSPGGNSSSGSPGS